MNFTCNMFIDLHNCLSKQYSTYVTPLTYDKDITSAVAIQGEWRREANNLQNLQQSRPRIVDTDAVRTEIITWHILITMTEYHGNIKC